MDLQTLLLAMSIPSGVTAFCFWLIEEKMKRERQEREQKEAIRQQSEILLIKSVMAAIALGEAAATALKNGHANGETEAALEYARKIKHEQKDFLTEQGIKGIYEEKQTMKKIDWVRKLTSRKMWTAVASFVSMMIVATGGTENTATQVTALIMAGASVVAYIIGEGLTDQANVGVETTVEVTEEKEV